VSDNYKGWILRGHLLERVNSIQDADAYNPNWVLWHAGNKDFSVKAKHLRRIISKLPVRTIIDVGCASGVLVDMLNRTGKYEATGVDKSESSISYANSHARGTFYRADIEDFKSDRTYSLVILMHLLEHCYQPQKVLRNVREYVPVGGYIYVSVPNLLSWDEHSFWRRSLASTIFADEHLVAFSPSALVSTLNDSGWEVAKVLTKTHFHVFLENFIKGLYRQNKKVHEYVGPLVNNSPGRLLENIVHSPLRYLVCLNAYLSQRHNRGAELIVLAKRIE
jgi:2-polyprenyl-3-methyl-5-hydroxy-6-metoxy-1,4-benzoquinol methylase